MIILAWVLAVSSALTVICGIAWWLVVDRKLFLQLSVVMLGIIALATFLTGGMWGFTYILGYR